MSEGVVPSRVATGFGLGVTSGRGEGTPVVNAFCSCGKANLNQEGMTMPGNGDIGGGSLKVNVRRWPQGGGPADPEIESVFQDRTPGGANQYITFDFPPGTLVGGNPQTNPVEVKMPLNANTKVDFRWPTGPGPSSKTP